MAIGAAIGAVVTFTAEGTTQAGVVIGHPSTTVDLIAYDFALPNGGQIVHCKEATTTADVVVSGQQD